MEGEGNTNAEQIRQIASPIYEARLWMKLVAVLSILSGLMLVLTVIGIIVAWLPIWMGVLVFQAASKAEEAHVSGDQATLVDSLGKIRTYFIISGVLALLGVLWTIFVVFMGAAIGVLGAAGGL